MTRSRRFVLGAPDQDDRPGDAQPRMRGEGELSADEGHCSHAGRRSLRIVGEGSGRLCGEASPSLAYGAGLLIPLGCEPLARSNRAASAAPVAQFG